VCEHTLTYTKLSKPETITLERHSPRAAPDDALHGSMYAPQEVSHPHNAICNADACFLVLLLQMDFVWEESVRVQGLQQPCELGRDEQRPQPRSGTRAEHIAGHMRSAGVKDEERLRAAHVGAQRLTQEPHELHAQPLVHPSAPLPPHVYVWRARGAQGCHIAQWKRALVGNEHLRQRALDVWVVAYKGHVRDVCPTLVARDDLRGQGHPFAIIRLPLPPPWNRQIAVSSKLIRTARFPPGRLAK